MRSISPAATRPVRPGRFRTLLAIALAATLLPSCGIGVFTRSVFGETLDITVVVDDVANNEYPLAMEVVYVYDEDLLKQLLQMTAKQWFEKRDQLRNDYPEGSGFASWTWEWAPGQSETVHLPLRPSADAGIIFVNYFTEGQHRVRIPLYRDIRVAMGFSDFTVEPE